MFYSKEDEFRDQKVILAAVPLRLRKYFENVNTTFIGNSTEVLELDKIVEIRKLIEMYNEDQKIYNENRFGPVQKNTTIIAIQVHNRLMYLAHLIVSLARVGGINSTLLVFSHDYFDEEINDLVQTVDFAMVMQIFYPYSLQTHPREFPGVDPRDCPPEMMFGEKTFCNNVMSPDGFGRYREASVVQIKHHWWWKANRIFNQLQCTIGHTGTVLFLEEDHYVVEDIIHMIDLLRATADSVCPECEILAFGTPQTRKDYNLVNIGNWHPIYHNMGFAFNKTVWRTIWEAHKDFCTYDDYNWDYSLRYLFENRRNRSRFAVMACDAARVYHFGSCGAHRNRTDCASFKEVNRLMQHLQECRPQMYPKQVDVRRVSKYWDFKKQVVGSGGWGDTRDHELCKNMTKVGRQLKKRPSVFHLLLNKTKGRSLKRPRESL